LFVRKSVRDFEKELSELNHRIAKMEKELEHVEMLEKMQAQHEIILAKKISDINRFDSELKKHVNQADLEEVKKELKRFEEHETILFENSRFLREIVNELGKIKESHRQTKQHIMEKGHISKNEFEDRLAMITDALKDLEHIRASHKKKAAIEDLAYIRNELHERMSQLEYQNKLIMKYLKKIDELLQKN
jgi:hypothetical protein